jgi:hypothetical protein
VLLRSQCKSILVVLDACHAGQAELDALMQPGAEQPREESGTQYGRYVQLLASSVMGLPSEEYRDGRGGYFTTAWLAVLEDPATFAETEAAKSLASIAQLTCARMVAAGCPHVCTPGFLHRDEGCTAEWAFHNPLATLHGALPPDLGALFTGRE